MALLKTFLSRQFVLSTQRAIIASIRLSSNEPKAPVPLKPTEIIAKQSDDPVEIENPFKKDQKLCILCKLNITPNYKNYRLLSQFQSPYTGRIYGRHITGLCKAKQAMVESEISKAQNCAYMPYYSKNKEFFNDPKLFDPENPIRQHRF